MQAKVLLCFCLLALGGCKSNPSKQVDNTADIFKTACLSNSTSDSVWHISKLFDCKSKTLFIPYQLWTGMSWDGNKKASCMHQANSDFWVNGSSHTKIEGSINYKGQPVWKRSKTDGSKVQYFACHDKGIGRVYDSRKPNRVYSQGRCKFPAGYSWAIGQKRHCTNTAIEIILVDLDKQNNLQAIVFKWWYKNRAGRYIHDHTYLYEVGVGMINAWR